MNLCLLHLQAHSNQMALCYDLLHEKQVINIFLKAPFYLIYAFLKTYITWTNYKWSSLFISPPKMPSVFQNLDSLMHLDQGILAFLGTFKKCFDVLLNPFSSSSYWFQGTLSVRLFKNEIPWSIKSRSPCLFICTFKITKYFVS